MTVDKVVAVFKGIGLPITYLQWAQDLSGRNTVPPLPYLVYYFPEVDPEPADDTVHATIYGINLELYTKRKDFTTEARIDAALTAAGLVWRKSESYLNSEHMFEVLYQMEEPIWEELDTD